MTVGGSVSDSATLSGGASPTGAITFKLYGPGDASCSGDPVATSSVTVDSGNGTYSSSPVTPDSPGTYRWVASYGGDGDNDPVAAACGDQGESVSIAPKPSPPSNSQAPPDATTRAATAVAHKHAKLHGNVNGHGLGTSWHFVYGRTKSYRKSTRLHSLGGAAPSVTITGLTPGTRYHFRVVARSSEGVTRGADRTFRTHGVKPVPTIVLSGSGTGQVDRAGYVAVPGVLLHCPWAQGPCTAEVEIDTNVAHQSGRTAAAATRMLARGKLTLAAHTSARLRLRVTRAGRQLLTRQHRIPVRARISARNRAGRSRVARQGFTLARP